MPQAIFAKAVKKYLPSAIPISLEKVDEYSVGNILVYSKKPRKLIPMRKHELDFTGFPLQSLLAEGSKELNITTVKTFLFDTDKSTVSKSANVDISSDFDLENSVAKLCTLKADLDMSGKQAKTLTIGTDFGKLTHVATDLVTTIIHGKLRANTDHPIVKKAVENGGVMFVITDIYEAEKCDVTVTLSKDSKEAAKVDLEAAKSKTKDAEDVDDKHQSTTVVKREEATPLAYLLMKVCVDSKGVISTQLNTRLSSKLHGKTKHFISASADQSNSDPYQGWVVVDFQDSKSSEPSMAESVLVSSELEGERRRGSEQQQQQQQTTPTSPPTQPSAPSEPGVVQKEGGDGSSGGGRKEVAEDEVHFPNPAPFSVTHETSASDEVKVKKAKKLSGTKQSDGGAKMTEPQPIPVGSAVDGPDDHYIYSLKDFQPFESMTYQGVLGETKQWVAPLLANKKLHDAFFEYTKPPKTYERLNDLSSYFLDVGNAMRAGQAPPPNHLKDIDPILDALSPSDEGSEKRLGEITSVIIVAEAADEFPQHIVHKVIDLPEDKRQLLKKIILETPYGSSRHTYAGEGPYKDPALKPIMGRMGFSIPQGTHNLVHSRKESDEEEDTLAAALILLLASEKTK